MPKIYIIFLNYNGWKDTIECLESVLKNDYENYQIIVVDNDSPNNSMEYIINWAEGKQEVVYDENSQLKYLSQPFEPKPLDYVFYTKEEALNGGDRKKESKLNNPIIFIQSDENGGFAAGNNIGIKYALAKNDFEYVWLLNNDTVIEKDSLTQIYHTFKDLETTYNIGAIGSKISYYNEPDMIQSIGRRLGFFTKLNNISLNEIEQDKKYVKCDDIMGASMFIPKEYIQNIGLIPEEYFLYMEETDWNYRGRRVGYNFFTALKSKIYHKESPSVGGTKSYLNIFYNTRNKIFFLKKYKYTHLIPLFILHKLFEILRELFSGDRTIIKAIFVGILHGLSNKKSSL